MKTLEKEKRQLDIKVDKLDRLCRSLQQERLDLKTKIKDLTKSSTNDYSNTSNEKISSGFSIESFFVY